METERKALTLLGIGAIAAATAFPKEAEASSPSNLLTEPNTNNHIDLGPIENLRPTLESRELREIQNPLVLIDWSWQLPENSTFTETGVIDELTEEQIGELAVNPLYRQMLERNVQIGAAFIEGGFLQSPDFNTTVSLYVDENRNMHVSSYLSFEDGELTGIIVEDIDQEKNFQAYIEREGVELYTIGRTPEGRPVMVYQNPSEEPGTFVLSFGDNSSAELAGIIPLAPGDAEIAREFEFPPLVNASNGSANVRNSASTQGEDIGDITAVEPRLVAGVVTGSDNYEWYGFVGGGFSRADVVSSTPIRVAGQQVVIEPTAVPDQTVLVENPPFVGDPLTAADFGDSLDAPWSEYGITEVEYNEARQVAYNILPEEVQEMVENGDAFYNHSIRGFVNSRNQVYRPHMGTENSDWLDQWGRATATTSEGRTVTILFEGSEADMVHRDNFGVEPFVRLTPNAEFQTRFQNWVDNHDMSRFPDVLIVDYIPELPDRNGRDVNEQGEVQNDYIARVYVRGDAQGTPAFSMGNEFIDEDTLQIRAYFFTGNNQITGNNSREDLVLNNNISFYIYFATRGGNGNVFQMQESPLVADEIERYFPAWPNAVHLFDVTPVPSPSS